MAWSKACQGGTRNRLPVQGVRASREVKIRAEWGPSTTLHLNSVQPVENPSRRAWSLSTAAHTAGQPTRHPDPNGTRRYGSSPAVWTRCCRSRHSGRVLPNRVKKAPCMQNVDAGCWKLAGPLDPASCIRLCSSSACYRENVFDGALLDEPAEPMALTVAMYDPDGSA